MSIWQRWKKTASDHAPRTSAFEELALPLASSLYNTAFWLARNATDAEDLVQETFLKALRGFSSFEPGTNFKAWIFRILRNSYLSSQTGLAALRTVPLEQQIGEDSGGPVPEAVLNRHTPETSLLLLADRAALEAAMEQLPPRMLEVILLCDVEELSYRDIATVLDVPIGTVMSRLARARTALRTSLLTHSKPARELRP